MLPDTLVEHGLRHQRRMPSGGREPYRAPDSTRILADRERARTRKDGAGKAYGALLRIKLRTLMPLKYLYSYDSDQAVPYPKGLALGDLAPVHSGGHATRRG
jgi:hypothetical protein